MKLTCPYCGSIATLGESRRVYFGQDFGLMYICDNYPACDAYVGVHKGTTQPLGRLANKELREWKKAAHAHFDPLWKLKILKIKRVHRGNRRNLAYAWLADQLGISIRETHIGMFDVPMCMRVVEVCKQYLSNKNEIT